MKWLTLALIAPALVAQDASLFERLEYRSIGPAVMGGRITDIEGVPGNPWLVYTATASGGLWKTINGGTTWRPIFDHASTISIGNIAVDPHNSDVVWLGSGERTRATASALAMASTRRWTEERHGATSACAIRITFRGSSSIP